MVSQRRAHACDSQKRKAVLTSVVHWREERSDLGKRVRQQWQAKERDTMHIGKERTVIETESTLLRWLVNGERRSWQI